MAHEYSVSFHNEQLVIMVKSFSVPFVLVSFALVFVSWASATVYFKDDFSDGEEWKNRWVHSQITRPKYGKFIVGVGPLTTDPKGDRGLYPSENNRQYAISSSFAPFSNEGKELVIQFTVSNMRSLGCGGGYIKLFPSTTDLTKLHKKSPYLLMFGPDTCGSFYQNIRFELNIKGSIASWKTNATFENDELTHVYSLRLFPNDTYTVNIDGADEEIGSIKDTFPISVPEKIMDYSHKKPSDWDDYKFIRDPNDEKPADWDKEPARILKPKAVKPSTHDEATMGPWVHPTVANPKYKGEWKPRIIPNPNFNGPWVYPEIKNPDHPDNGVNYHVLRDIGAIGIETWEAKPGLVFDNFLVTDDWEVAKEFIDTTFQVISKRESDYLPIYKKKPKSRAPIGNLLDSDYEDYLDDEEVAIGDQIIWSKPVSELSSEEIEMVEDIAKSYGLPPKKKTDGESAQESTNPIKESRRSNKQARDEL